jgi:hypothetical protein
VKYPHSEFDTPRRFQDAIGDIKIRNTKPGPKPVKLFTEEETFLLVTTTGGRKSC